MAILGRPSISPVQTENPDVTSPAALAIREPIELDATSPPKPTEKRVAMHKERENDPAVLIDLPKTPQAEELEKVGVMGEG
ncbi:hypothetical protein KC354_g1650 [Hortaea werneckii]|nr:hypothetical protein KC354_g1650 [Hortaea werneckii]